MAVYNVEDYIEEAIDSVINQSFDFNKVQLIIVDDGSPDNSKEIALKYQSQYPNNILVLSKENGGQASARNYGLKYAEGKYINFLDSDDKLSKNTLSAIYDFYKKNDDIDIVSIPMFLFERKEEPHNLNPKFNNKTRIVNLLDDIFSIQLSAPSSFIKKSVLDGHTFNTKLVHGEDSLLINKILINKKKYGLIGLDENAYYLYRKRFLSNSTVDESDKDERFFTYKLKNYFKYLFDYSIEKEGHIPKFIQALVIYDLYGTSKTDELPENWDEDKIQEFWDCFRDILNSIDNEIIINHKFVPKRYKAFFMYIKNNEFHIVPKPKKHQVFLRSGRYNVNKLHFHKLNLDSVDLRDGFLTFVGNFSSSSYHEAIRIEAVKKSKGKSKEIFLANYRDYGNAIKSVRKFLSINWIYNYNFDIAIPIEDLEESKIVLRVVYEEDGKKVIMNENRIKFGYRANLSDFNQYFVKNSRIVKFEDNTFYTFPYTFSSFVKNELISIKKILFSGGESLGTAFLYRLIYLISFIFMKNKRIWLFNDRPLYADDNGKYLFEYSISKDDGIKKYFVLDKESQDFKDMKKISQNILSFGSFKHKFLYMFAEKRITSHRLESYINPFNNENITFYSGVINSDLYFLQHGIILGDMSKDTNKRYRNLSLFVTSSDFERNSILEGDYNYDEDVVQLLGLPRHDYLQNKNTKKQILFSPTWRNYLITEKSLLSSEYFLRLNSFLNNKKLLDVLKENGYNLVFKPHPELIEYIDLFDCNNENVIISQDDSYQDLFNESSLMITDYSSVFFDFAYLKKPIIYYQYADEYNYDEGYFDFKTMGFGELVEDENSLVDKIIEYIENDCLMEDEYKQRVDKFFKYSDRNNCKRVYDWILEH